MSDKPEQKKGWFQRLTSGLARSSQQMTDQVTGVFTKKPLDQEQLDALEEMLIEADLGPDIAGRIADGHLAEERMQCRAGHLYTSGGENSFRPAVSLSNGIQTGAAVMHHVW